MATKKQIIAKLVEAEIEFDETASAKELEALLPESEDEDKDYATVSWRGNTRVYSLEVHGESFQELAEEFASKVGGIVA